MKTKKNIAYLGNLDFPKGFAEVQKIILISKGLILAGNSVTVICSRGIHDEKNDSEISPEGEFQGIKYIYTTGTPFYYKNFIKRNLLKIKGRVNEFLLLKKMRRNNQLDFAILSTHNFFTVFYYYCLSKIIGFKTVLNYVEFYSKTKKNWNQFKDWINDLLFDKYSPLLVDSVFPISEYIISHLKKTAPNKKYLKVPVLTDFEKYNGVEGLDNQNYFLFCGHTNYNEVIKFIIDSFNNLNDSKSALHLVVNGDEDKIHEIKNYINTTPLNSKIKVYSNLSEKELYTLYKNALALLIPLRPTFQDTARFPHKIGEYLASGNPVISTNYGEVKNYFSDKVNMIIAESYNIEHFSEKMKFVLTHPKKSKEIGVNGQQFALEKFDYKEQGKLIDTFLSQL